MGAIVSFIAPPGPTEKLAPTPTVAITKLISVLEALSMELHHRCSQQAFTKEVVEGETYMELS